MPRFRRLSEYQRPHETHCPRCGSRLQETSRLYCQPDEALRMKQQERWEANGRPWLGAT